MDPLKENLYITESEDDYRPLTGKTKVFAVTVFVILAICVLVTLGMEFQIENPGENSGENVLIECSQNWVDEAGDPADLSDLTSLKDVNKDGKTSIYLMLPEVIPHEQRLMFLSSHINIHAYVQGREIYAYEPQVYPLISKSYGTAYNSIWIKREYAGLRFRMDIDPVYHDSARIKSIYIGNGGPYLKSYVNHYLPSLTLSIVIFVLGVLFLIFAHVLPQPRALMRSLSAFSVASMLLGLWALNETRMMILLLGHPGIWRSFDYPILMVLPYLCVVTVNGLLRRPRAIYTRIAGIVVLGDILLCFAAKFLFRMDLHECRVPIHSCLLLSGLFVLYMLYRDRKVEKETEDGHMTLFIGLAIAVSCAIIDTIRYYFTESAMFDSALFIRIGFFLLEVLLFYKYIITIIHSMRTEGETDMYRRMAFKDALTGLGNRAAFVADEKGLKRRIREDGITIGVCQMDLDELKQVNDVQGHAIGDDYIKESASLIRSAFGGRGSVYRVGGDEFTAFVVGEDAEKNIEQALGTLMEGMEKQNAAPERTWNFSVSFGYAIATGKDVDLDALEAADRHMYEDKQYKKEARNEKDAK